MTTHLRISLTTTTHTGMVRDHNEDDFGVIAPHYLEAEDGSMTMEKDQAILLAVADGMGGMEAGEIASHTAIEALQSNQDLVSKLALSSVGIEASLKNLVTHAHDAILDEGANKPETSGMGTTLVLAYLQGNRLHLCWSGDSRAYLFDSRGFEKTHPFDLDYLRLLTDDHSMVWNMVQAGKLTPDEARRHKNSNVITQSLGDVFSPPQPETRSYIVEPGQKLLLCSDGLNSMLPDTAIEEILSGEGADRELAQKLIETANEAGGHDNITVVLLTVIEAPTGEGHTALSSEASPAATPDRPDIITTRSQSATPVVPSAGTRQRKSKIAPVLTWAVILAFGVTGGFAAFSWINDRQEGDLSSTDTGIPVSETADVQEQTEIPEVPRGPQETAEKLKQEPGTAPKTPAAERPQELHDQPAARAGNNAPVTISGSIVEREVVEDILRTTFKQLDQLEQKDKTNDLRKEVTRLSEQLAKTGDNDQATLAALHKEAEKVLNAIHSLNKETAAAGRTAGVSSDSLQSNAKDTIKPDQ